MFELADKLQIKLRFQGPVAPRDNGDTEPLSIQPSPAAWAKLKSLQKQRRKQQGITIAPAAKETVLDRVCGIGTRGVDIDPFGNVYPCMHLKNSAGSLHQKSIMQIWNGVQGRQVLAGAEQLSLDAALQFRHKPLEQYGAPLFCPAVAVNSTKGCSSSCGDQGCSS
jgi:MoaA/NifB/PqqE/SkfB family radical SAM enzyme